MKTTLKVAGSVVAITLCSLSGTFATTEGPCTFLQPILTYDTGVMPCPITYACQGDNWSSPGYAVGRVFSPNRIGTSRGFENRNAASLAGIRADFVPHPEPRDKNQFRGLFGDTLKVRLEIPPPDSLFADSLWSGWGDAIQDVVKVTVTCMRENARQEYPRYRFLDVRIQGGDEFSEFEGLFEISPLEKNEK